MLRRLPSLLLRGRPLASPPIAARPLAVGSRRCCASQAADATDAAADAEPPPGLGPWSLASDVPIRLSPEMRPEGDTSRKYVRVDEKGRAYATGRRKTAVARTWVWEVAEDEAPTITINKMDVSRFFGGHWLHREALMSPFLVTDTAGRFSVMATVKGGGLSGQTEALRLGIATAMQGLDLRFRPALKRMGFLRRDPRRRERLKPGQPGARKQPPWVKR